MKPPLLMTREHVAHYYKLSTQESVDLCEKLESRGFYHSPDNPLFSKADVEKELKNVGQD